MLRQSSLVIWLLLLLPVERLQAQLHHGFHRQWFEQHVARAMDRVRDILSEERTVELAEHQEHTYQDKFALVELVTRTTWALLLESLDSLGMDVSAQGAKAAAGEKVQLTLETNGTCQFIQEKETKVAGTGSEVLDAQGNVVRGKRDVQYTKEYHWNVTVEYHLYTCDESWQNKHTLRSRSASSVLVTATKAPPRKEKLGQVATLNLSKWLRQATADQPFSINREQETCKTPRRNRDVDRVLQLQSKIFEWCGQAGEQLFSYMGGRPMNPKARDVTVMPLPLLENSTVINEALISRLLLQQKQILQETLDKVHANLREPAPDLIVSTQEGTIDVILKHISELVYAYHQSVAYIEDLLQRQLLQAIGKEVRASDFSEYMIFHNRKLFGDRFTPNPFSHAVRRPNQYPVGLVSIEDAKSPINQPIYTFTRRIAGKDFTPLAIPINAATQVEITGDRYLAGWIRYDFSSEAPSDFVLAARARQFSSFLLLIGTITGPETFDPKHGIILKNKDEVKIFLNAEVLPSAKEFKDAIKSLSPEQQEFARAFRAMQLESSVFGVCVIQLKPQLEKLLNLPDGALSKEIELTEELTSLFVDFQIPSDLLSYDGPTEAPMSDKVDTVKSYVRSVLNVIDASKNKQLEEERMRAKTRQAMYKSTWADEDGGSGGASAAPSSSPPSYSASMDRMVGEQQTVQAAFQSLSVDDAVGGQNLRRVKEEARHASDESEHSSAPTPETPRQKDWRAFSGKQSSEDFSAIPKILDEKLEKYDTDGALRSMIIKAGGPWLRKRQENLLVAAMERRLNMNEIERETKKGFRPIGCNQ